MNGYASTKLGINFTFEDRKISASRRVEIYTAHFYVLRARFTRRNPWLERHRNPQRSSLQNFRQPSM